MYFKSHHLNVTPENILHRRLDDSVELKCTDLAYNVPPRLLFIHWHFSSSSASAAAAVSERIKSFRLMDTILGACLWSRSSQSSVPNHIIRRTRTNSKWAPDETSVAINKRTIRCDKGGHSWSGQDPFG